ncbi:interleukin-27 receptor subunit alpha-like [Carcharodon carcharias]|uniref:interleukin-27 receptor subunit alpha-like n=1 Tax=Carcharodon carcharias TaxID=13397 RepID=UPI001B7E8431|nr:interleukin-27 receptor subunit alpha-like [Carcharodon carcharias]
MREVTINICCNITLPGTTQLVNVTAFNSIGATQPAKLNLIQDCPSPFNMTIHSRNHSVLVSWEPPANTTPHEFVVEWKMMNSEYKPDWKKIPAANLCVTLTDDVLYPLFPYNISVYARYRGGVGGPVSTLVYREEGVPLAGPEISILNISQTGVTLLWNVLPLDRRQGFVRYYTLYYVKKPGGEDKHKALNISCIVDRYTLLDLAPDCTYKIWMTASTIVGEGSRGPYLNFRTQGSQTVFWMLVVLVPGSVVIGVIWILFCRYCEQRMQSYSSFYLPQWCCQKIPDPRNSRVGHQQHHCIPSYLGMMEEPPTAEVEEIEIKDEFEISLTKRTNSTLTRDKEPSTEDQYWIGQPSPDVDNPPEAPTCLDEKLMDQPPSSTRLMGGVPFTSGYERHFIPSEEDLLNNEWQLENKEEWLGLGDITDDF